VAAAAPRSLSTRKKTPPRHAFRGNNLWEKEKAQLRDM